MKKDFYEIERQTIENYDGTKTTCYCIKHNGEELQSLHWCEIGRLAEFLKAIDDDITKSNNEAGGEE